MTCDSVARDPWSTSYQDSTGVLKMAGILSPDAYQEDPIIFGCIFCVRVFVILLDRTMENAQDYRYPGLPEVAIPGRL